MRCDSEVTRARSPSGQRENPYYAAPDCHVAARGSVSVCMNENHCSLSIRMQPIEETDEAEVDRLLDRLIRYSMLVEGVRR
jgi:hypothetical protein